jgi:hypothetical protein
VKNGVPYDVAFTLGEADVAAYAIIFGELGNGNTRYNWDSMQWEKRE